MLVRPSLIRFVHRIYTLSYIINHCCGSRYPLTDLDCQTNTIIHFQVKSLGDAQSASWIANANFLVTLAFGPVLGSLGDRFGKRWFIIVAAMLGVVGSCTSGSAQKTTVVIGGNILTGLANAGCVRRPPLRVLSSCP